MNLFYFKHDKKNEIQEKREEYNAKCINFLETKFPFDTYSTIYEEIHKIIGECTNLRIGQVIDNMRYMDIGETDEFKIFHSNIINSLNEGLHIDFFYEEPIDTYKRWIRKNETVENKD